jgi:hypothetical protein
MSTLRLAAAFLLSLFKSRRQLFLENLALKQQVAMLRQSVPDTLRPSSGYRRTVASTGLPLVLALEKPTP